MGILSWISKAGNFASRFAGKTGMVGSIAGGISRVANLINTHVPKIVNIGKTVYGAVKTGLGIMQKTGLLNRIDKKGNFTKLASKVGLVNNTSNQNDVQQSSGGGN